MDRDFRIESSRLYLRYPRRTDFRTWQRLREASRDHLTPFEPRWAPDANSKREWGIRMRAWRQAQRDKRGFTFLIFARETDMLLGGVAVTNVRWGAARTATLGYWLGADAAGQGFMTEAVKAVCEWAKSDLELARLEAGTVEENARSQRVLERAGFCKEGLAKSYLQIAGERRDHILYGLRLVAE